MDYEEFDSDFPHRCLELLGKRPFDEQGFACTKLIAIGGTLISATGDRHFSWGTEIHIATGLKGRSPSALTEFLERDATEAMKGLRAELQERYPTSTPPAHWNWDPACFQLTEVRAGDSELLSKALKEYQGNPHYRLDGENWNVRLLLRTFRNAISHGNVWTVSGLRFPGCPTRHSAGSKIVGFVFATTNPEIRAPADDSDLCPKCRKSRKKPDAATTFKVRGILISVFDLRALVEGWAIVLKRNQLGRRESGENLCDGSQGE